MEFNLVTEKWLPVLYRDGHSEMVSLDGIFKDAHDIDILSGPVYEQASLLMLLAGIAQVSLGRLRNRVEWEESQGKVAESARRYLKAHQGEFDLWDEKRPFGQIAGYSEQKTDDGKTIEIGNRSAFRLSFSHASGHNHTLYDMEARFNGQKRQMSNAEIARGLLNVQSFDVAGLVKAKGGGWRGYVNNLTPAPLNKRLITMVWGKNLLDTIWLCLVSDEDIGFEALGRPFWETQFPDMQSARDYSLTYFGWILPISRAIHVHSLSRISFTEALGEGEKKDADYQATRQRIFRHPLLVRKEKGGYYEMGSEKDWFVWRELGAALSSLPVLSHANPDNYPFPLKRLGWYNGLNPARVVAGGFDVTDKFRSKASLPRESIFVLEPNSSDWQVYYCNCLKFAEKQSEILQAGEKAYRDFFFKRNGKEKKQQETPKFLTSATEAFWWKLNQRPGLLRETVFSRNDIGTAQRKKQLWEDYCQKTRLEAYDEAFGTCPSSRDVLAYAMGKLKMNKMDQGDTQMNSPIIPSDIHKLVMGLAAVRDDHGMMKKFRMGVFEKLDHLTYTFLFRQVGREFDEKTSDRFRAAVTLMVVFAHHRQHSAVAGNFGVSLAKLWRAEYGNRDGVERRFRVLIETNQKMLRYVLCQWAKRLSENGIAIDYEILFLDLLGWGNETVKKWAECFARGTAGEE
jgi:CRISPR type I-E-associated protein CasB/Cse2